MSSAWRLAWPAALVVAWLSRDPGACDGQDVVQTSDGHVDGWLAFSFEGLPPRRTP
jgi:hypothetical protein